MEHYWTLTYGPYNATKTIDIPPAAVETVKRRWAEGQPIHTTNLSIPASDIRAFEKSERPFGVAALGSGLAAEAAQAFHEPILIDQGEGYEAIESRWVKQAVPRERWSRYYANLPGYRSLGEDNGMTTIAFRLPTHLIDPYRTPYCSDAEVSELTRR